MIDDLRENYRVSYIYMEAVAVVLKGFQPWICLRSTVYEY